MGKLILSLALLLATLQVSAQDEKPEKAADRKIKWGFNTGINISSVQTKIADAGNPFGIQTSNGIALRLGILMDYKINDELGFSPKAELSFNNNKVSRLGGDNGRITYEIYPVTAELAFHFTYKFLSGDIKPYVLAGPNLKIPILDQRSYTHQLSPYPDVAFDIGIGAEKVLPMFFIAPELRYSIGLLNVGGIEGVQNLYFHNITFVFNVKA